MQQVPVQKTTPTKPIQHKQVQQKPVQHKPVQKSHHNTYAENLPGRVAGLTAFREVARAMPGSGFGSRVLGNTAGILAGDAVRHEVNKLTHHHHPQCNSSFEKSKRNVL